MMKKQTIDVFKHADEVLQALARGAVVPAQADGKTNAMTISWGTLGREWERPIFTIFLRETRYTHELIENTSGVYGLHSSGRVPAQSCRYFRYAERA